MRLEFILLRIKRLKAIYLLGIIDDRYKDKQCMHILTYTFGLGI